MGRTTAARVVTAAVQFAIGGALIAWGFIGAVPLLFFLPVGIPLVLFVGGAIAGTSLQSMYPGAIWRMGLGGVAMGIAGLILIPAWIPNDASKWTVPSLLTPLLVIFAAGAPFTLTLRDGDGAAAWAQTFTALAIGACVAVVVASTLAWSGQTERYIVVGVAFTFGYVASGVALRRDASSKVGSSAV